MIEFENLPEPTELELEELETLEDLIADPIHYAMIKVSGIDYYEGGGIELHNQISFKGVRLA